jgi:hypothetical protein
MKENIFSFLINFSYNRKKSGSGLLSSGRK